VQKSTSWSGVGAVSGDRTTVTVAPFTPVPPAWSSSTVTV